MIYVPILAAYTTRPMATKVPLSIESLLQKQKEEREAASKVLSYQFLVLHMLTVMPSAKVPDEGGARIDCDPETHAGD